MHSPIAADAAPAKDPVGPRARKGQAASGFGSPTAPRGAAVPPKMLQATSEPLRLLPPPLGEAKVASADATQNQEKGKHHERHH
jgi:hypothetical protein